MTLAKKGRRKIVVDGSHYFWRVMRNIGDPLLYCVVEREASPQGAIMIFGDGYICPSIVEKSIRKALKEGWNPGMPGKPFNIDKKYPKHEIPRSPKLGNL